MTTPLMYKVGVVVLAAGLFGACSSDNSTSGGATNDQPSADETLAPIDPAATTGDAGTTAPAPAPDAGAGAGAEDLCTAIPDLATIEATIGVAVKDPLGVGAAGFQQSCNLLRTADDSSGVVFTLVPGGTIAGQIQFVKTNFNIDIVPLEGADGFYDGEADSVYYEGNGNLYQVAVTADVDNQTASLDLLKVWLGM